MNIIGIYWGIEQHKLNNTFTFISIKELTFYDLIELRDAVDQAFKHTFLQNTETGLRLYRF